MSGKHMKSSNNNLLEKLLHEKEFQINLLNSQIVHKNNEIKDFKQDVLNTLRQIINLGEANKYNNSQVAIKKMKEIAEDKYKRIAVELYDLDLSNADTKIELPITDKSK